MADQKKAVVRKQRAGRDKSARADAAIRATRHNGILAALENLGPARTAFLICVLSLLSYANSLGGDFVFDDTDQIVENQDIRSWDNLGRAFTTHVWAFREKPEALRVPIPPPYYRPLFTILFTIEYKLFGLWPQGWHLVSLLLHILCSIGVFYVLQFLASRGVAALAAMLFAVYSIHVESVSWISGVTDPLFGFFFLASFYFYLKHKKELKRSLLVWSLVMFALSTLSKETALSLVLLIFCAELIEGTGESSSSTKASLSGVSTRLTRAAVMTLPYFGVAVLYLIPRYLVIGGISWDNPHTYSGPFINVLLTIPFVICSYFLHLIWPVNLSITYFTRFETSAASPRFLFPALALLAAASLLFFYCRKIRKDVWYGLALLIIPLLPVLDLRKLSVEYLIFDRYLYLSVAGWVFLIAIGLARLATHEGRQSAQKLVVVSSVLAAALIVLMTAATAKENSSWANAVSLWSQAARVRPDFWVTHYNSGLALYDVKRYEESREALMKAAALAPDEPTIFHALGRTYTAMGERSLGIQNFKRAIEIDPEMFESINNLGSISFDLGDYTSAERYFKSALALRPQATDFHYNLGLCYSRQGRIAEAIPELERAQQSAPNDVGVLYELGLVYERAGRREDALKVLQRGLSISTSQELIDKVSEALRRVTRT